MEFWPIGHSKLRYKNFWRLSSFSFKCDWQIIEVWMHSLVDSDKSTNDNWCFYFLSNQTNRNYKVTDTTEKKNSWGNSLFISWILTISMKLQLISNEAVFAEIFSKTVMYHIKWNFFFEKKIAKWFDKLPRKAKFFMGCVHHSTLMSLLLASVQTKSKVALTTPMKKRKNSKPTFKLGDLVISADRKCKWVTTNWSYDLFTIGETFSWCHGPK